MVLICIQAVYLKVIRSVEKKNFFFAQTQNSICYYYYFTDKFNSINKICAINIEEKLGNSKLARFCLQSICMKINHGLKNNISITLKIIRKHRALFLFFFLKLSTMREKNVSHRAKVA